MEFYDKRPVKSKESYFQHGIYLEPSEENVLGECDAVTLNMLYLKVLHDMVSQNSEINFSEAAIMS